MRIASIADIHCRASDRKAAEMLLKDIKGKADVLVIAGDLTDNGQPEEAQIVLEIIKEVGISAVAVLGNHDHEAGKADEITRLLSNGGVCMLDGSVHQIADVGFVGTKGFCGGFGDCLVMPFGENALKAFIQAGIDEAINLENALARLKECKHKMVVLHYAPIAETLNGEPPELYAFLGSERLANAIDRRGADVIIHGHAHHGSPFGHTAGNIPVYNVSRFVQEAHGNPPYCIIDL